MNLEIEELPSRDEGEAKILSLPSLSEEEREEIDPQVPPTSGIRLRVMDQKAPNQYVITKRYYGMFLRILKATSLVCEKRLGRKFRVLIVSNDRPSCSWITDIATKVFANDGHRIIYQIGRGGTSRLS